MSYYVYIVQSAVDNTFYKGFSENPQARLLQHNNRASFYNAQKVPWQLVCLLEFPTKTEALIKERKLKKYPKTII